MLHDIQPGHGDTVTTSSDPGAHTSQAAPGSQTSPGQPQRSPAPVPLTEATQREGLTHNGSRCAHPPATRLPALEANDQGRRPAAETREPMAQTTPSTGQASPLDGRHRGSVSGPECSSTSNERLMGTTTGLTPCAEGRGDTTSAAFPAPLEGAASPSKAAPPGSNSRQRHEGSGGYPICHPWRGINGDALPWLVVPRRQRTPGRSLPRCASKDASAHPTW